MKKALILLALATTVAVADEIQADYTEGERSAELITPEIETAAKALLGSDDAAKLLHAVRLQMAKYDHDMRSSSGRREWHGTLLRQEVYTNDLCAIEVYTNKLDGSLWRYKYPFKPRPTAAEANARRLKQPPLVKGIPKKLAEARLKRYQELNTKSNVTVNVEAGVRQ